jgi:hypothetical protein
LIFRSFFVLIHRQSLHPSRAALSGGLPDQVRK